MKTQDYFSIALLLIVLGVIGYWYYTRPTPQEKSVIQFFEHVRRGNPDLADDYLKDESFGDYILSSKIIDSSGKDLRKLWSDNPENLENNARAYIPYAKGHVVKFDVEEISTQRERSVKDHAYVKFIFSFKIKEAIDAPGIPGSLSGMSELVRINGNWITVRSDIQIEITGRSIESYTRYNFN